MYHYLSGKLIEKSPTAVVIETNGIGYDVLIPVSTYSALPSLGEIAKLFIHFVVREDAQLFYGFATEEERRMFRHLISISGIGPKIATTALSGLLVDDLKIAIKEGNVAVLTSISGIGKKTAERIVIELREKMILDGVKSPAGAKGFSTPVSSEAEDAVQALVALGYTKNKAKEAVDKVLASDSNLPVDQMIRLALKYV